VIVYAEEYIVARTRTRTLENDDAEEKSGLIARLRRDEEEDLEEEDENGHLTARKDRPTPSVRDIKPRGTGSTGIVNRIPVIRSIVAYFRGVSTEMRKVTWPSREETTRLTTVVLGVTAAFSIGLGILNTFYSWWFQQAFHADSEWIFLVVAAAVTVVASGTYFTFRNRI
jgi:preprotein translocase SecE subunit